MGCLDVQRIVTKRNGHRLHGDSWSTVCTGFYEDLMEVYVHASRAKPMQRDQSTKSRIGA